jgi:hypothetical protein
VFVRKIAAVVSLSVISVGMTVATAEAAAAPRHFANCTALNQVYPHGVGRPGAVDHTSGTRVTTFRRDLALYNANSGSDRDKDGIACEKA